MRLLANENMASSLIRLLRERGHGVLSAKESMRGYDDAGILSRAVADQRVLLTFDKDFGELAFRWRLPASCGVILTRIEPRGREEAIQRAIVAISARED